MGIYISPQYKIPKGSEKPVYAPTDLANSYDYKQPTDVSPYKRTRQISRMQGTFTEAAVSGSGTTNTAVGTVATRCILKQLLMNAAWYGTSINGVQTVRVDVQRNGAFIFQARILIASLPQSQNIVTFSDLLCEVGDTVTLVVTRVNAVTVTHSSMCTLMFLELDE